MAAGALAVTHLLQVLPQVQVDGVPVFIGMEVGLWKDRSR